MLRLGGIWNPKTKSQTKKLFFGLGLGMGISTQGLGCDQPGWQVLRYSCSVFCCNCKCDSRFCLLSHWAFLVLGHLNLSPQQERFEINIWTHVSWLSSPWNDSRAISVSERRRSQLCLVIFQIDGALLKTSARALCLALYRIRYRIDTSKARLYSKANSSGFHFTAHKKMFIFFLTGSSFRLPLINYLFCTSDIICLHLYLNHFLFAAEWLAPPETNKVLKQLQAEWGNLDNVLKKKKS